GNVRPSATATAACDSVVAAGAGHIRGEPGAALRVQPDICVKPAAVAGLHAAVAALLLGLRAAVRLDLPVAPAAVAPGQDVPGTPRAVSVGVAAACKAGQDSAAAGATRAAVRPWGD